MANRSTLPPFNFYEDDEVVFFSNPIQTVMYMYWGAEMVDIFPKTNSAKATFVFWRTDHERLKKRWELNKDSFGLVGGKDGK